MTDLPIATPRTYYPLKTGNRAGHRVSSGRFRCGCEKTPENSVVAGGGYSRCRKHYLLRLRNWNRAKKAQQ